MHLLRLRWPFVLYACGLVLPAPALPAPPQAPAVAALVKMMHDDRRSQAALVSRLADAELKASDPGLSPADRKRHAEVLARCGRRDEALRALDVALALDPKNPRALKWEARLKENAPELFTGVLEEPADKTSLAALGVMALLGQTPKDRYLLAVEAACRTLTRRMLAALRAPAARREVALRQAAALPTQVVGTLIGPAKEAFHSSLGKLDAAKTAADAKAAFAAVPLEAGVHPLYWQARSKEFVLARDHRGHLDCILAALALDPQNAWAKGKRAAVEGLLASASAATSTVATPAKAVPEGPVAVEVRTEFQTETQAAIWAGDFPKAEAAIAAALARNPADAAALIQRARVRLGRFEMPAAEADAKAAVAAGGKTLAEAHGVLATVQFALGKTAEATASGTKALELVPDQPDALLALAQLDSKENRGAPALAKLDRCLAARPGFEEALAAKAGALVQVRMSAEVPPSCRPGWRRTPSR